MRSGKTVLRWGVIAAALLFWGQTLRGHWAEVLALRLTPEAGTLLGGAFAITLLAHGWSGWAWSWILQALGQPVGGRWSLGVYLKTNLWKYLPGNVWHFYGRLQALRTLGIAPIPALLAVVLDPVLMAAAALLVGLAAPTPHWPWQLALLILVLGSLHPTVLNPLLQRLGQGKAKTLTAATLLESPDSDATHPESPDSKSPDSKSPDSTLPSPQNFAPTTALLHQYPLKPLAGEVGFVLLRGLGFGLIVNALSPLPGEIWLPIISRFSLAWLAGLVIPGAPGGLGVVEALAVPLLQDQVAVAVILSATAIYRLVSTLTEALGAGLAQWFLPSR